MLCPGAPSRCRYKNVKKNGQNPAKKRPKSAAGETRDQADRAPAWLPSAKTIRLKTAKKLTKAARNWLKNGPRTGQKRPKPGKSGQNPAKNGQRPVSAASCARNWTEIDTDAQERRREHTGPEAPEFSFPLRPSHLVAWGLKGSVRVSNPQPPILT